MVMECKNCNGRNFRLDKWAWVISRSGLRIINARLVCTQCDSRIQREYGNESMLSRAFPGIDIMQYKQN
jgi:ribosomal protein L33